MGLLPLCGQPIRSAQSLESLRFSYPVMAQVLEGPRLPGCSSGSLAAETLLPRAAQRAQHLEHGGRRGARGAASL